MTKASKPPEPDHVRNWREWIKAGPPRCCHTCEFFKDDGRCSAFDMAPPPDFAAKADACDRWEQEIPF
jgi:hypothetical protein